METLPIEMVLKISNQLTPEDLARCCRVSKRWREIFNQDWLWKPHCDPALEEHLRTTPCVVEPMFVTPGDRNSTLTPVSQWRLAFMREKHLYNNWKHNNYKTENLVVQDDGADRRFLTNNHIVRCCSTTIEVWDVSVVPSVFVTKTDPSIVRIAGWIGLGLFGGSQIVVFTYSLVKVLSVDVSNKCIALKHVIELDDVRNIILDANKRYLPATTDYILQVINVTSDNTGLLLLHDWQHFKINDLNCIKGNFFIHVNTSRSNLDIFDLEKGKKIKVEACPVITTGNQRPEIRGITTSPTSDYVVVVVVKVETAESSTDNNNRLYYIYNPKKLCFLPGPVVSRRLRENSHYEMLRQDYGKIHRHYFAIPDNNGILTVYDCHSRATLLSLSSISLDGRFFVHGLNDYFIVFNHRHYPVKASVLKMFSLSTLTWSAVPECENVQQIEVLNNRLIVGRGRLITHCSTFMLGNEWLKSDISIDCQPEINLTLTKMLYQNNLHIGPERYNIKNIIYHYW